MNSIIVCFVLMWVLVLAVYIALSLKIKELYKLIPMQGDINNSVNSKIKWLFDQLDQLKQDIEVQADIRKINNDLLWEELDEIRDKIKELKAVQINDTNALIRRMGEIEVEQRRLKTTILGIGLLYENLEKRNRKSLIKTKTNYSKRRKR